MFIHTKKLQYNAKPSKPDPIMARRMQEILGGQYGEISVMMQYLFQGWNTRGNDQFKDLFLDTATEEIGHVEMIATMIAYLLDDAPIGVQEEAYASDPAIAAIMGGMNPQHAIVSGLGAVAKDANGVPWNAGYIIASGNILADLRANINAESQGRVQVARLYHMTDDPGIRDMLGFLLARDTMHQLQWIKAAKEIEDQHGLIVPYDVPEDFEVAEVNNILYNFSQGEDSKPLFEGEKATEPDNRPFEYKEKPEAMADEDEPKHKPAPPELHNTPNLTDKMK